MKLQKRETFFLEKAKLVRNNMSEQILCEKFSRVLDVWGKYDVFSSN